VLWVPLAPEAYSQISNSIFTTSESISNSPQAPVAATATPIPLIQTEVVPFGQLGFEGQILNGPYDSTDISFAYPPDWLLKFGTDVQVNFKVLSNTGLENDQLPTHHLDGTLQVYFNWVRIASIPLDHIGEYEVRAGILGWDLNPLEDGTNFVRIALVSEEGCEYDIPISVYIYPTSSLKLKYIRARSYPYPRLASLPRPIFQSQNFLPAKATIVIPDQPTESEIQAALDVSAGFGSMTKGELEMNLTTASQLTEEERETNHLIF
ncbi:unnamed protein product, partial [marine sediment metagenome]